MSVASDKKATTDSTEVNEPGAGCSSAMSVNTNPAAGQITGAGTSVSFGDIESGRPINNSGGVWAFIKRLWYNTTLWFLTFKWTIVQWCTKHRGVNMDKLPKRPREMAVVTGGGHGIGLQVAKKLLLADMHVIIGTLNEAEATDSLAEIKEQISSGSYEILPLDLKQIQSVKLFVRTILAKDMPVSVLVNNAGILLAPYEMTEHEMESHFQVNYHSHFVLTILLMPSIMLAGQPDKHSRIINVSSLNYSGGSLDFSDMQMKKFYSPAKAYMQSKLAQVVFSKYLARKLKNGVGPPNVSVFSVHPGFSMTEYYQNVYLIRIFKPVYKFLWKNPAKAADSIVFAALSPDAEGTGNSGIFVSNCRSYTAHRIARDQLVQENLWKVSCGYAGMDPKFELIEQVVPKSTASAPVVASAAAPVSVPTSGSSMTSTTTTTTTNTKDKKISGRVQLQEVIVTKNGGSGSSSVGKRRASVTPPSPTIPEAPEAVAMEEIKI